MQPSVRAPAGGGKKPWRQNKAAAKYFYMRRRCFGMCKGRLMNSRGQTHFLYLVYNFRPDNFDFSRTAGMRRLRQPLDIAHHPLKSRAAFVCRRRPDLPNRKENSGCQSKKNIDTLEVFYYIFHWYQPVSLYTEKPITANQAPAAASH